MEDWWKRTRESGYLAKIGRPRIQWGRRTGTSFYSAIKDSDSDVDLFKDAYNRACHIRGIMEVPSSAAIKLVDEDGGDIFESSAACVKCGSTVLDRTFNPDRAMDAFLGQVCVSSGFVSKGVKPRSSAEFPLLIEKYIEEERVIRQVLEEYPGYEELITEYKKHKFHSSSSNNFLNESEAIIHTLKHIIQWPEYVSQEVLDTYPALFSEIQKVLDDWAPQPDFSYNKSRKITEIIKKYLEDPEQFESQAGQQGDNQENESKDSPNDSKGDNSSNNSDGKDTSEGSGDSQEEKDSAGSEGQDDKEGNTANKESKSSSTKSDKYKEFKRKKFQDEFRRGTCSREVVKELRAYRNQTDHTRKLSEETALMIQGDLRKEDNVVYRKVEDNTNRYQSVKQEIASQILPLVNTFSKFMQSSQYKLSGMRRGVLDTNKLAEAYQNVETVFSNTIRREASALDVCLLIDQSGSMYGRKIKTAQKAAILLNEVFNRLPKCRFFIYGHSADEHREETVIRVFRDNWNRNKYSLGKCSAYSNNRDHEAIQKVHQLVRKQTSNPLLMFVISDGAPAAYGYRGEADGRDKVRKVVNNIEKQDNTIICQISIEEYLKWETMFNYGIQLTNMDTFASDLSSYILKTLISKLKIEEK